MSRWQETFDSHAIHETLKELKRLANSEFEDIDENEIPERRRFIKALTAYEEALSGLDAELVPINQLDSLNNALRHQNILAQLTSYAGTHNISHLVAANDHLSSQLTQLSMVMAIARPPSAEAPIKQLEEMVDYISNSLIEKKTALVEQLENLTASVTNSEQGLAQLEALIEKRKTETDSQLTQWQQQFAEAQERRNTEFSTWKDKVNEEAEQYTQEIVDKSNETLSKHQDDFNTSIKETLDDADAKHKAILDLYELTAGDSVGAGYLKNALEERKQANLWRWISIVFIVATAGWLFYAYSQSSLTVVDGGIIWSKVLTVFSLTSVLLFGAALSSQQSNRHRANEKRASWFALQVKAIDPFINSLEPKERNELKRLLSERLFANPDEINEGSGSVISEHAVNVIVKSITDILGKVPKS
ncbi:MAG: hypothetical protein WD425_14120 [Nitrospirales bacterium]